MATAASREELALVDKRVKLWFYLYNIMEAERGREVEIGVRNTNHDRASGSYLSKRYPVQRFRKPICRFLHQGFTVTEG